MLSFIFTFVLVVSLLSSGVSAGQLDVTVDGASNKVCTVTAAGNRKDDTGTILNAFKECNDGGRIVFPKNQTYWIAQRLHPVVKNIQIDWHGQWKVSI
jgi:galacturan 1,4-alpha-galacturonidase